MSVVQRQLLKRGSATKPLPSMWYRTSCWRALLRLPIGGRIWVKCGRSSDGGGEFGERRGDAESARDVESEFVMSAANVLY
jgi:hypothetical protein